MSKNYFYEIIFSRVALIIFVVLMFIVMGIAKQSPGVVAVIPNEEIGTRLLLPNGLVIKTEVVDTPELRSKGLSGRTGLGEHESMLFAFETEDYYNFWMPDMNFAVDMIWMDKDYQIVDITENAKPMPGTPLEELPKYKSIEPAQYVLEVNSGFSDQHDLEVGDKIKLT